MMNRKWKIIFFTIMDSKILGCIGWLILIIGIIVINSIINGYVLSILWGWFFVTIFELPNLTIIQAIGVGLVVAFLTRHSISSPDNSKDWSTRIGEAISNIIAMPFFTLLIGYIIYRLMQ